MLILDFLLSAITGGVTNLLCFTLSTFSILALTSSSISSIDEAFLFLLISSRLAFAIAILLFNSNSNSGFTLSPLNVVSDILVSFAPVFLGKSSVLIGALSLTSAFSLPRLIVVFLFSLGLYALISSRFRLG